MVAGQAFHVGNSHLYLTDKTGRRPFRSSMFLFAPNCSLQRKSMEIGSTNFRQVNRSRKKWKEKIYRKERESIDFGYSVIHDEAS